MIDSIQHLLNPAEKTHVLHLHLPFLCFYCVCSVCVFFWRRLCFVFYLTTETCLCWHVQLQLVENNVIKFILFSLMFRSVGVGSKGRILFFFFFSKWRESSQINQNMDPTNVIKHLMHVVPTIIYFWYITFSIHISYFIF